MPRNGSGTFSRVRDWTTDAANGLNIEASLMDSDTDDIASAITDSIAKDGQTTPTANLPMGGFRHTNVGSATARSQYGVVGDIQDNDYAYGTVGGTANAISVTLSPAPTSYATGMALDFFVGTTNSSTVTINVNGLGAKDLHGPDGALSAGQIVAGDYLRAVYDGTRFKAQIYARTGSVGIQATVFDAKGDLIVASAADTAGRLAVGNDGTNLQASSGASNGQVWAAPTYAGVRNAALAASVAGNALTIALKGADGSDPSATNPVVIPTRSTTATSGDYDWFVQTAASSVVVPSGATLGTSNNVPFRIWVVVFNNGGIIQLGVINCLSATDVYPLSDDRIASSTTIGTGADSAQVFYTTSGVTSKAFRVLGYFDYGSGLGTAGAYASAPTFGVMHGPGSKLPGDTVQRVRTYFTSLVAPAGVAIPRDDTIPQSTEGAEYMTRAITPTSAANVLRILGHATVNPEVGDQAVIALFQDATANALSAAAWTGGGADEPEIIDIDHCMVAGTTSSTTFKVRMGNDGGDVISMSGGSGARFFGGVANSFMEVVELMG